MTKGKSSHPQIASARSAASTAISEQSFAVNREQMLFDQAPQMVPGSMNDASLVRAALVESIRKCGKSRETIADQMSMLTGTEVTVRRLNAFTAESREDFRWPAELDRAFCAVTGCNELMCCRAELAGFRLITKDEAELLELGREYIRHKRAHERVEMLEKRLQGVDL
jgi:hypothetical protein